MANPPRTLPFRPAAPGTRQARARRATRVERRAAPRVPASALPALSARLLDGPGIDIVNLSRTGLLTRSQVRLVPGAMIGLRFLTADASLVIFGRVVRSSLVSIAEDEPLYESALALSHDLPPVRGLPQSAAAVPTAVVSVSPPPHVGPYPREIGRPGGEPVVLTVNTSERDGHEDVLKVFDVPVGRRGVRRG
jgi:hypothetical protein